MNLNESVDIQTFNYSFDWRFFLPISTESKVLVLGQGCQEVKQFLDLLGFTFVKAYSEIATLLSTGNDGQYPDTRQMGDMPADFLSYFDAVVMPYGTPSPKPAAGRFSQFDLYMNLKRFIRPNGTLMVGFSNRLHFWRPPRSNEGSTPWRTATSLKRAGYIAIHKYGVLPYSHVPDFIFPLTVNAVGFILKHKYRAKIPSGILNAISNPLYTPLLLNLFPSYFFIARAP